MAGTVSDYLCPFCYDPLYVNARTMTDACLNRSCPAYSGWGVFSGDLAGHDGPRQAELDCAKSIRRLRKFGRRFLLQSLYKARARECERLLRGGGLDLDVLASIDYLLTQLGGNGGWGALEDARALGRDLDQYYRDFGRLRFADSLCQATFATNSDVEPYVLKYQGALAAFHAALGLVNAEGGPGGAATYPFRFIDQRSVGGPARDAFDFEAIYRNSLAPVSSLNHVFKMGRRVSKIHRYPARPGDFAALLSVWKTCPPGRAGTITAEGLREIYDGSIKKNKMRGDFDCFLKDYTSGLEYAPILVFDGEKYHFGYPTLLLYLLYLFSNNDTRAGTQTETGNAAYINAKMKASDHFEETVRQKLRDDGFEVYPRPDQGQLRVSFDNHRAEFDCIAVDRARKTIVLLEAKYEDVAPSSKAGTTLVDQAVLDRRRGLLGQAKRHHCRRRLFRGNFGGMRRYGLALEGSFHDYTVHTLLVTKHEPLISRHMAVDIMSYDTFMSADFRGGRRGARKSRNRGHAP